MDDLLQEFIAETRETLDALAGEIVAWEGRPSDRSRLDAIFRFVHTVKGSCGFLDLPRLARLSHAAEDVLASVRDGRRLPDTALVSAVLSIVDRIGQLVEAIDSGEALEDASDDLLIAALAEDAKPTLTADVAAPSRAAVRSVRLSVDIIDRMMSGMSDMVLARNELARRLRDIEMQPPVEAALERMTASVAEMRDTVTRMRMQKIDALFAALPRLVRDTAAGLGKAINLEIGGSEVELDREMIEMMRDPLIHIIRNALDHGIEMPAARRAAGKRETGRLRVSARQSGNQIIIEIADDGQGIDTRRLAAKAIAMGLRSEQEIAVTSEATCMELIFEPGLSSRDNVTDVSGRGVGMDVVRANVEQIGGRIALANRPGQGLTITIQVPLTLSIIPTIIVGAGGQRYAVARSAVEEIVQVHAGAVGLVEIGGSMIVDLRGRRLPLVSLGDMLGTTPSGEEVLVVITTRDGEYALAIDEVCDAEELVIKPASPAVMAAGIYAGQTLPDSGLPMLLLDAAAIAARAGLDFSRSFAVETEPEAPSDDTMPALLFEALDGRRRAVALAAIDRIDRVPADCVQHSGGRARLVSDGALLPLQPDIAGSVREAELRIIRLTDGAATVAYAIREAVDIVAMPRELAPAHGDPSLLGVAMIDGAPVEIIDVYAVFAGEHGTACAPICVLREDGSQWMESFLRPTLEAAGYRCVASPPPNASCVITLAFDDDESAQGDVIRLRRTPDATHQMNSVYRYDRETLIARLSERVGRIAA